MRTLTTYPRIPKSAESRIRDTDMASEIVEYSKNNIPVFLFGIGSGAYLKSMIRHSPKEANVIVYEPSMAIFLAVLTEIDLTEEIKNRPIAFVVEGLNEMEFIPIVQGVLALETLEFFIEEVHPNYKAAFPEQLKEKIKQLTKLVSAGPSLDKNIEELQRAKNHLFLVAVDTAVKPLLKRGIVPDVFITLDGRKPLDLLEGAELLPVVSNSMARYKLLDRQKGRKIFFFDGYRLPLELYLENGKMLHGVAVGGSVACSGFSLLYKMGFETVILVGQDLAYTDNKSHADGTFQEKMPEEETEHMIRVKGNYQDTIPTLSNLKIYLEWFEDYIKGAKEHGAFRVINATEGGAYIEGTELLTLKEALDECIGEETDFAGLIDAMESAFTPEEREKAYDSLMEIPKQFEELEKLAKQLKKEYEKIKKLKRSGKGNRQNYEKILKKTKKLTEKCYEYSGYQLMEETLGTAEYILQTEFYYGQEDTEEKNEILQTANHGM